MYLFQLMLICLIERMVEQKEDKIAFNFWGEITEPFKVNY